MEPGLLEIFREGQDQERAVLRLLEDAGFKISQSQTSFYWEEFNIAGHLDGFLSPDFPCPDWPQEDGHPKAVPFEIKTMQPYTFAKINSIDDMFESHQEWLRRYPAQLMIYLLLSNEELGVFILKDKSRARIKEIWVPLDWIYADSLLEKAKGVKKSLELNEPPGRREGDYCANCPFLLLCQPELILKDGAVLKDDAELEALIERKLELAPLAKEYDEISKEIHRNIEDVPRLIVGNYLIQGRWVSRKGYQVPDGKYWKSSIRKLEEPIKSEE
ncbi:MAG: hypothetical protein ABC559_01980 [Candidatus Methanosuratincola petrocarbonis]